MTLPLELGGIQDPSVRRAFEQIAQLFPLQEQNMALRTVRGTINGATGAIIAGTGFTAARSAGGTYAITFTPVFNSVPAVMLTADTSGGAAVAVLNGLPTTSVANVFTLLTTTGALADKNFSFVAVGP